MSPERYCHAKEGRVYTGVVKTKGVEEGRQAGRQAGRQCEYMPSRRNAVSGRPSEATERRGREGR